ELIGSCPAGWAGSGPTRNSDRARTSRVARMRDTENLSFEEPTAGPPAGGSRSNPLANALTRLQSTRDKLTQARSASDGTSRRWRSGLVSVLPALRLLSPA